MDQAPPPTGETDEQRDIRLNKDVAAFSYIWIMSVIIFASRRDSKFVQYHSKQGIILFLLSVITYLIPWAGKFLAMLVVAGMLLGFINAAQGRYADVPIVGDLSRGKLNVWDLVRMAGNGLRRLFDTLKNALRRSPAPPVSPPPRSFANDVAPPQSPTSEVTPAPPAPPGV